MQNALHPEAIVNWSGYAPTSGDPTQPPTTHYATQPPNPPERTVHRIDADFIESVLVDTRTRIDLLLDESDFAVLPISRKVFREAVACGLLKLVRDPAGQVVKVENSDPYQELSIEDVNSLFGVGGQDQFMIGSHHPVTGGSNPCGLDSEVNWASSFSNHNDGLNLAERGETMQATFATLDGDRADVDMPTFVHGPGPVSRRYGGGSAAAQL